MRNLIVCISYIDDGLLHLAKKKICMQKQKSKTLNKKKSRKSCLNYLSMVFSFPSIVIMFRFLQMMMSLCKHAFDAAFGNFFFRHPIRLMDGWMDLFISNFMQENLWLVCLCVNVPWERESVKTGKENEGERCWCLSLFYGHIQTSFFFQNPWLGYITCT